MRPVKLPPKDLTEREAEKFWRQDRKHLLLCADSNEALRSFYVDLRERLSTPEL